MFGLYHLTNSYANHLATAQTQSQVQIISNVATTLDSHIPFIPPSILIYACSVPLLALAYLTADSWDRLWQVNFYLIISTLIACLCFYLFPLEVSYPPKTIADYQYFGINWHPLYQLLGSMDKPFNQLPSLHACYALIVGFVIARQRRFIGNFINSCRYLLVFLSLLVGISTLTTHQHHIYDIVFGVLLAVCVIVLESYLANYQSRYQSQLIIKYTSIAIAGFLLINIVPLLYIDNISQIGKITIKGIATYHLLSFLLLALCYSNVPIFITLRHRLFKKSDNKNTIGQLPIIAYIAMLPIISIYRLMWFMANKFKLLKLPNAPIAVRPNTDIIAIANPNAKFINELQQMYKNYQHIIWLDMASETSSHCAKLAQPNISYRHIAILDLMPIDSEQNKIRKTLTWLSQTIHKDDNIDKATLIICQCSMGLQRSISMLACVLMYFDDTITPHHLYQLLDKNYPYHRLHRYILNHEFLQFIKS